MGVLHYHLLSLSRYDNLLSNTKLRGVNFRRITQLVMPLSIHCLLK